MTDSAPQILDGALIVDKPPGLTSHDVVAAVRRATGVSRVGHTGTLDPMATGVLPLLVGRATRLAQYLAHGSKTYDARIRLGWTTDTYDRTGLPTSEPRPVSIASESLERQLARFRGTFEQRPPAVSAKKVDGRRAYAVARGGQEAPVLRPVPVTVQELTLQAIEQDEITVRVTATAGFYVRSLAHDLGQALGCGAHLAELRRTASGPFGVEQAVALDRLIGEPSRAAGLLIPMSALLPDWPAAVVTESGADRVSHGTMLLAEHVGEMPGATGGLVRVVDASGALLAIARRENGPFLQPIVVLM